MMMFEAMLQRGRIPRPPLVPARPPAPAGQLVKCPRQDPKKTQKTAACVGTRARSKPADHKPGKQDSCFQDPCLQHECRRIPVNTILHWRWTSVAWGSSSPPPARTIHCVARSWTRRCWCGRGGCSPPSASSPTSSFPRTRASPTSSPSRRCARMLVGVLASGNRDKRPCPLVWFVASKDALSHQRMRCGSSGERSILSQRSSDLYWS